MICPKCNTGNEGWASQCKSCGTILKEPVIQKIPENIEKLPEEPQQKREPILASILSFLYMGLGQAYNGQRGKGYMFFSTIPILMILYFILMKVLNEPFPKRGDEPSFHSPSYVIATLCYICIWFFNVYDAYQSAKKINEGEISIDSTPGKSAFIFLVTVIAWFIGILICIPLIAILLGFLARIIR